MTTPTATFVVDTHAVVWYLTDDPKLSRIAASVFARTEAGDARLVIPTIVLAELLTIAEKKRAGIDMNRVLDWMLANSGVMVESFDLLTFAQMILVPDTLEMHDRIIAATARRYTLPVVTRDPALARAVETIW